MKKNLIVIGVGGGIGNEVAKFFSHEYNVIGVTHQTEVKDKSINFYKLYTEVDIRNISNYETVCKSIMKDIKRIDGIVYTSGITLPGAIEDISIDDWNNSIDINLKGYWLTFKFFKKLLIKSPGCSIVQINSKTGKKGSFKNSAYTASKFGGIGLTQSMALELVSYGVRVNCICAGNVFETATWNDPKKGLFVKYAKTQNSTPEKIKQKYIDLVPMKRSCHYKDICNLLKFLLSDASSYMTGQAINLTGGQQLV